MLVSQRGTSSTGVTTSGYYAADRWRFGVNSMGTWTIDKAGSAPTSAGFGQSLSFNVTTADAAPAAGDFAYIEQRLIGRDLQSLRKGESTAQQLTVSFWCQSDTTGTYVVELYDNDNTRHICQTVTINAADTWEYKTVTFSGDTTGALDTGENWSLSLIIWIGAGADYTSGTLAESWAGVTAANRAVGQVNLAAATSNYFRLSGVQLQIGPVATGYNFESFQKTMDACSYYYERVRVSFYAGAAPSTAHSTTLTYQKKRATPTFTLVAAGTDVNLASFAIDNAENNSARMIMTLGASAGGGGRQFAVYAIDAEI